MLNALPLFSFIYKKTFCKIRCTTNRKPFAFKEFPVQKKQNFHKYFRINEKTYSIKFSLTQFEGFVNTQNRKKIFRSLSIQKQLFYMHRSTSFIETSSRDSYPQFSQYPAIEYTE